MVLVLFMYCVVNVFAAFVCLLFFPVSKEKNIKIQLQIIYLLKKKLGKIRKLNLKLPVK